MPKEQYTRDELDDNAIQLKKIQHSQLFLAAAQNNLDAAEQGLNENIVRNAHITTILENDATTLNRIEDSLDA